MDLVSGGMLALAIGAAAFAIGNALWAEPQDDG